MADKDVDLNIKFTGDATSVVAAGDAVKSTFTGLESALAPIVAQLGQLNTTMTTAEADLQKLGSATEQSTAKLREHAAATSTAKKESSELATVGGDMARMFSSLGIESGTAASRVGALAGALGGLKDAAPELAALTASVVSLFGAFELGKDAISSATALQDQMLRLGMAVRNQGGDWTVLSGQVKAYADLQAQLTKFTDTEVIGSLNRLVQSGLSVRDAMVVNRVAEDAAAGTGRDLGMVTLGLIEAEKGRTNSLMTLGVATRAQIKDGMSFDEMLQLIEKHMGGDAQAAASGYSGALAGLGAAWTKLMEDGGAPFLVMLTEVVKNITEVVSAIDDRLAPAFKSLTAWFTAHKTDINDFFGHLMNAVGVTVDTFNATVIPAFQKLGQAVSDVGNLMHPFLTGQLKALDDALLDGKTGWDGYNLFIERTLGTLGAFVSAVGQAIQAAHDLVASGSSLGDWVNDQIARMGPVGRWIANVDRSIGGGGVQLPEGAQSYDVTASMMAAAARGGGSGGGAFRPVTTFNPRVGGTTGRGGTPGAPYVGADVTPDFHMQSDAIKELNAVLADLPKNLDGYNQALKMLAPVITQDIDRQGVLQQQLDAARYHLADVAEQYNKLNDSMQGHQATKETAEQWKQQQSALKALREEVTAAQKNVTDLSSAYEKNASELDALEKKERAAQDAIKKLQTDWTDYVASENEKYNESVVTFKMTNEEKAAFYLQWAESIKGIDKDSNAERMAAYGKFISAEEALDKERYQTEQNFLTASAQHFAAFFDAIIIGHQSLASQLKNIYQEILKWFLEMLSQMLAQALTTMPIIQAMLGLGGGGLNFGPGLGASFIPGSVGGAAQIGGGAAASPALAAIAGGMRSAMSASGGGGGVASGGFASGGGGGFGSNAVGGGGGGGGIYSPSAGPSAMTMPGASGFGGGGGGGGGGFGPGMLAAPMALRGLGGGVLGALGLAGVGGGLLGSAAFGGRGYSGIGGALGALGATLGFGAMIAGSAGLAALGPAMLALLSNPVGIGLVVGAALLGGFGGSLFGDHFSHGAEPDVYQQQQWGQALADLQGSTSSKPMNASGRQFIMDSQTRTATNNKGWNILFEDFVNRFRGNPSQLPAYLQDAFPELEQLWGGATNKPDFNSDGKDGYLDVGSGKRDVWTKFWGAVTAYGQDVANIMQQYQPTDLYIASVNGAVRQQGSLTQGGGLGFGSPFAMGANGSNAGSNAIGAGGGGRLAGTLVQRMAQSININVTQNNSASLISSHNLEKTIRDALSAAAPWTMENMQTR